MNYYRECKGCVRDNWIDYVCIKCKRYIKRKINELEIELKNANDNYNDKDNLFWKDDRSTII